MSTERVGENFLTYSVTRLGQLQVLVAACCDRLNEEQMWQRGAAHENSVGNLLLHLSGNMRQWILHGIGGEADVRDRDAEFTLIKVHSAEEARKVFRKAIVQSVAIIAALPQGRLLEVIDPQPTGTWRNPTVLEAIYKVVSHVDHHAGQIIVLTKQMVGTDLNLSIPRKH